MDIRERIAEPTRRHPWEIARQRFLAARLAEQRAPAALDVLDVGSGDAWLADALSRALPSGSRVTCWDIAYEEPARTEIAALRGPQVTLTADLPERRFDQIWLFDVLEHIDDDEDTLKRLVRDHLTPGGQVWITVPAWPWLYSEHDERLLHHRRYEPRALRRILVDTGLRVEASGGLFYGLLGPRWLRAVAERRGWTRRTAPDLSAWDHGAAFTWLVETGLRADNRLAAWTARRRLPLPGTSWWARCTAS